MAILSPNYHAYATYDDAAVIARRRAKALQEPFHVLRRVGVAPCFVVTSRMDYDNTLHLITIDQHGNETEEN